MTTTALAGVLAIILAAQPAVGGPASAASQPGGQLKSGVNFDALTVDDCHHRLALPKSQRPVDPDPRVDLDGVCRNILSGMKRSAAAKSNTQPAHALSPAH